MRRTAHRRPGAWIWCVPVVLLALLVLWQPPREVGEIAQVALHKSGSNEVPSRRPGQPLTGEPERVQAKALPGADKAKSAESSGDSMLPAPPVHLVFPTEEDLPHLIASLKDPSAIVRENAAAALGTFSVSAEEAIPALTATAEADPVMEVRRRAREALYNIRGHDPAFIEAVASPKK